MAIRQHAACTHIHAHSLALTQTQTATSTTRRALGLHTEQGEQLLLVLRIGWLRTPSPHTGCKLGRLLLLLLLLWVRLRRMGERAGTRINWRRRG